MMNQASSNPEQYKKEQEEKKKLEKDAKKDETIAIEVKKQ
jgi:hypothetical protein